jgi:hypothetical protein
MTKSYFQQKSEQEFVQWLEEVYQHAIDLGCYAEARVRQTVVEPEEDPPTLTWWKGLDRECSSQAHAYYQVALKAERILHFTIDLPQSSFQRGEQIYLTEFVQEGE